MKNKHVYPSQYELWEIFSTITNRNFLNEFAQRKGIFIHKCTHEDLAKELSILFYDEEDLELIRKEAYNSSSNHSLNGFTITTTKKKFNLVTAYESIREQGLAPKGVILDSLVKQGEYYKGAFQYTKRKAGRIEFLQEEDISFDFYIKKNDSNEWQVEIDGNKATDAKELRQLFKKRLSDDEQIDSIEQDDLGTAKLITFFDTLGDNGMGDSWKLEDIKHVTVRKGKEDGELKALSDEEDEDEDSSTIEVTDDDLIQIRQAILEGKQLRDNKVVKQFEAEGYKFTAMTYEFHQKNGPDVMLIKAEFKGRPKVFEVMIKSYENKTGLGNNRIIKHISAVENRKLRSTFWNSAKTIHKTL